MTELTPEEIVIDVIKFTDPEAVSLNLRKRNIRELPSIITKLAGLQILELSYNRLQSLPPHTIGKLRKLISFDLSYNQLTKLTLEIGQLANLTSLDLSNNRLSKLPMEISQLTNLISLNLWLPSPFGETKFKLSENESPAPVVSCGEFKSLFSIFKFAWTKYFFDLSSKRTLVLKSEI